MATLRHACHGLSDLGVVEAVSSVYETEPVGFADQPTYLNAAVRLRTEHPPVELMNNLFRIERSLGRVRTFPNAPRTIDLDLLLYGDAIIETLDLVVPHPRLHERAFVLQPLAEIAPDLVHPLLDVTVRELLAGAGSADGVQRISDSLHCSAPDT